MNFSSRWFWILLFVLPWACKGLKSPNPFNPYETDDIMPDSMGRISEDANDAGVKGRWYSYAGKESKIHPNPLEQFALKDGKICASGTASKVKEQQYTLYYGAGIGFYLCYSDDKDIPPEFPFTLSECPFSKLLPNMQKKIAGIQFDLELNIENHPEIRVIFREAQREEGPYVKVDTSGTQRALIMEAGFADYNPVCASDKTAEHKFSLSSHPSEIQSILFQVPSIDGAEREFDFCILDLKLLINPGEETDRNPYENWNPYSEDDAGVKCTPEFYEDAGLEWVDVDDEDGAFKILRTEVKAEQYLKCKEAGCCMNTAQQFVQCDAEWEKKIADWDICSVDNVQGEIRYGEPANCVNWYQAQAFCKWAGGRLPSEGQWSLAASGGDSKKRYPWGAENPSCALAVMDSGTEQCKEDEDPDKIKPESVCSRTRTDFPDELCDMAGNVWEWVDAWYLSEDIPENTFRMLKGGSYKSGVKALQIQSKSMEDPAFPRDRGKIGFRCVK